MQVGKYSFLKQSCVVYGKPAAEAVRIGIEERQAKRVLLVSSKTLNRKEDTAQEIGAEIGDALLQIYDDVEPHAPLPSVLKLAKLIGEEKPDLIINLGGGSVIDTVKVAILSAAAQAQTTEEIVAIRAVMNDAGEQLSPFQPAQILRHIDIPTTLSGAEFGIIGGGVDVDRNVKDIYKHPQLCADTVIYDPALARLTPNPLWISTGMRAVDHAVETLQSRGAIAFTDGPALNALRLFGRSLKAGDQKQIPLEQLLDAQFAVWSSTVGLGRIPYGGSHGIGHQLGAISGVPHGLCSCVLLPAVLRYNQEVAGETDALIANALGCPDLCAADAVLSLIRNLGLADSLKAAGVEQSDLQKIAAASLGTYFVENNLKPIRTIEDALSILVMAWET